MERRTNGINQKSKDTIRVGQIFLLQTKTTLGKNSLWLMGDLSVQNCAFTWAFIEVDGTTLEEESEWKVSLIKNFSEVLQSTC